MGLSTKGATLLIVIAVRCVRVAICDAQVLETETARFLRAGTYELGTAYEFQTSGEGTEHAVPLAAEWGVTDRLSFLVEPVAYTAIRPNAGPHATGAGDLEATALALVGRERGSRPAFAVALEVKIPTTKNTLIGTGQADFTGYLIGSKRMGHFDAHANLGYTILGRPPGTQLSNVVSGAIAGEYSITEHVELFGEVLGNTAAAPEAGDSQAQGARVVPEAAGGELVGTMGVGVRAAHNLLISLGLSYDNNQAFQIRPGVTLRLQ
jgi:hypothetical protein